MLVGAAPETAGRGAAARTRHAPSGATRAARLLAALFEEVLLVGGEPRPEAPGRRVGDPPGPPCALRGLVAALAAAEAPRVLVVAAGEARLTPDLALALVAWPEAEAVVPRSAEGAHPLCALYARHAVLPVARAHLEAGRLALADLLDAVATAWLAGADLPDPYSSSSSTPKCST